MSAYVAVSVVLGAIFFSIVLALLSSGISDRRLLAIPALLCLPAVVVAFGWLAVAPMPEWKSKQSLMKALGRLAQAYIFGGLLGGLYGALRCPSHFLMTSGLQFVGVHALIGFILWWLGSLVIRLFKPKG